MRFSTAVVFPTGLQSLLLLRDCSALLIRNAGTGLRRNWRPLMLSAASVITAPTTVGEKKNYWDKHRPEVPGKFLESIRTETWRGMFEPCSDHPLTEVQVEGTVPQGLEGTLFRNGPGRNREGDRAYGHWFDGNGHISKIVFKDGKVYAQNRFVDSDRWDPDAPEGERSASTVGAWTSRPGGWLKNVFKLPGNPRNTNVIVIKDKLYSLCEGGKPVEIDPVTLKTLEENDFGGIQAFYSAHAMTDPSTGETFSIALGGANGGLEITRVSSDGTLDKSALYMNPTSTIWHDIKLTKDYIVAVTSPYVATIPRMLKALLGFSTIGLAYKWDNNLKSEAFFFSRDTLELVRKVELPGVVSSYHLINAFQEEEKAGIVNVLVCKHRGDREELEAKFRDIMGSRFTSENLCDAFKYEVDVKTGALLSHGPMASMEEALPMELPTIDSRYVTKRNRFVYTNVMLGDAGFLNSVQRCDLQADGGAVWQTHDFGKSRYAGEPVFVPKSENAPEGDGYILVHVYNTKTHTTDIEVLDAQKLEEPPLCVAHVPWHMGSSLHGIFTREPYLAPPTAV